MLQDTDTSTPSFILWTPYSYNSAIILLYIYTCIRLPKPKPSSVIRAKQSNSADIIILLYSCLLSLSEVMNNSMYCPNMLIKQ